MEGYIALVFCEVWPVVTSTIVGYVHITKAKTKYLHIEQFAKIIFLYKSNLLKTMSPYMSMQFAVYINISQKSQNARAKWSLSMLVSKKYNVIRHSYSMPAITL